LTLEDAGLRRAGAINDAKGKEVAKWRLTFGRSIGNFEIA
jgi:hypothetical protein